jgi:hypothetical protein
VIAYPDLPDLPSIEVPLTCGQAVAHDDQRHHDDNEADEEVDDVRRTAKSKAFMRWPLGRARAREAIYVALPVAITTPLPLPDTTEVLCTRTLTHQISCRMLACTLRLKKPQEYLRHTSLIVLSSEAF